MNYQDHFLDFSTVWCYYQCNKLDIGLRNFNTSVSLTVPGDQLPSQTFLNSVKNRVTEIEVVIYLQMIPPTQLVSWLVAVNWLSICCKNKEINFFQDIGDTTSFDLELVTKDCINNDQIIMAVLQETRRKSNFFITFGCLVSADQPTINYKGRLRRKLTQTLIFPKSS